MDPIQSFYDRLADSYHRIFEDWEQARHNQARDLARLLRELDVGDTASILDCACGIGTQALGLAEAGYRITATDLSPKMVAQARQHAAMLGLEMTFGVADFRTLAEQVDGVFDVVLASGNALPHLLTVEEMKRAAENLLQKIRHGGLLIVSIRDYDAILEAPPHVTPVRVFDAPTGRRIYFQLWDWSPDYERYDFLLFLIEEAKNGAWHTEALRSTYRAWRRDDLMKIFSQVGFSEVVWRMPADTGHHSPIMTARRPAAAGQG